MTFELSIAAAFLAMIGWGVGDFIIQKNVRKMGNMESMAFIGIIGSVALLPFVSKEFSLLSSPKNLLLLLVLGVMVSLVSLLDMEALKRGKLSVVEFILELELPITVGLAFLFFKESLSLVQIAIIFPVFIGILLMAVKKGSFENPFKKLEKGAMIALATAGGMAAVNLFTASGSKQISPLMAIWVPWVVSTIFSVTVLLKRGMVGQLFVNLKRFTPQIIAMGLIDTAAWFFYAFAVNKNYVSIVIAITESFPAVALFLGVWLNKEKIHAHQYAGAFLALISCLLLTLTI